MHDFNFNGNADCEEFPACEIKWKRIISTSTGKINCRSNNKGKVVGIIKDLDFISFVHRTGTRNLNDNNSSTCERNKTLTITLTLTNKKGLLKV